MNEANKPMRVLFIQPEGNTRTDHNYQAKQLRMIAAGKYTDLGPGLHHVDIYHDDWCAALNIDGSRCNCDPDIVQRPEK